MKTYLMQCDSVTQMSDQPDQVLITAQSGEQAIEHTHALYGCQYEVQAEVNHYEGSYDPV